MARQANYDEKIETLTGKIEKKAAEIKALREDLSELKAKRNSQKMEEIAEFMDEQNLSPDQVLEILIDHIPEENASERPSHTDLSAA